MKTAKFRDLSVIIADSSVPVPGNSQLLVQVKYAGLNRPDLLQKMNLYPPVPGTTDTPGLELSGTVHSIGKDVSGFKEKDSVFALVPGGAFAEYAIVDVACCAKIPDGFSEQEAAAIPENYMTTWDNMVTRGNLKKDELVLIMGASGGIGNAAIHISRFFGAIPVAVVSTDEKAEFCRTVGAVHTINRSKEDIFEKCSEISSGQGIDLILDIVGKDNFRNYLKILRPEGRLAVIALMSGSDSEIDLRTLMMKRLTVFGSTLRPRTPAQKGAILSSLLEMFLPVFRKSGFKIHVDSVFPLDALSAALDKMQRNEHSGKILISFP